MNTETHNCPDCGCECRREEVDVEVGIQYGPWTCIACPWNENLELSRLGLDLDVTDDEFLESP